MVKVSIIVPAFNVEKYLHECLDSLINQTLGDIEVILINDGSTDMTTSICDAYADKDNRIKVIHQENGGLSNARNRGIQLAQGEFIIFVDGDDWIDNDTCEKAYELAIKNKADSIIFCSISEYGTKSVKKDIFDENNISFEKIDIRDSLFKGMIGLEKDKLRNPERIDRLIPAWGKLYNTRIIKDNNIKFIDLSRIPSECQLFNMEYYYYSEKTIYVKDHYYHYRRDNNASLTKSYKKGLLEKWLNWAEYVDEFCSNKNIKEDIANAYYNRICFSVIPLGRNCELKRSYFKVRKELREIISNEKYMQAFKKMEFNFLPLPWKVYFGLAKFRSVIGFYLMSKLMRILLEVRMK
ncbi:glycosyltransferase family 2 protein [Bacillus tianshenii]|uniref:glycosyltransferase family 2 protein n=1 Tax=Sutcliffiella tianshenii TaxID=1463404 RepID=UPI001CD31109|nr:glycosyltransferase family 2 protein [Bacillus tianshenii]MCA1320225.1 glycosyltransferase family 2 protein [Bacillus tianshenii]